MAKDKTVTPDTLAYYINAKRVQHQVHCALSGIPGGKYGNYKNDLALTYALSGHIDNYPNTPLELRESVRVDKYKFPTKAYKEKQQS